MTAGRASPSIRKVVGVAPRWKVERVRVLRCDLSLTRSDWHFAHGAIRDVRGLLVAMEDGEGGVGYGYAAEFVHDGETVESLLATMKRIADRRDWRRDANVASTLATWDHVVHRNRRAKAALELALIDLQAKTLNMPVHQYLGYGQGQSKTPVTRIVPLDTPERMADDGARLIEEEGIRGLKLKMEGVVDVDAKRVAAVASRAGSEISLAVDANQVYTAKEAIRLARTLDEHGVLIFEQPVARDDVSGLRAVRSATSCLVEADESVATLSDLVRLAREDAIDSVSIKISKMGGLVRSLAVANLCQELGIAYRLGAQFGSRIGEAACAQFLACMPSRLPNEVGEPEHLTGDPFGRGLIVDGHLVSGDGVGLGIDPPAIEPDAWEYTW